ncbi:MAG: acyl--CoA ligase [Anaerolineales bacterium]|nr:acyl--CoA ligase [Anaerolineales bacterium]
MNTSDYLLQTSQDQHLALITSQERYTYGDLKEASACIAQELFTQGVRSGDRVGLLSTNSLFWVASYLAILKLGAVVVPFSATLPIRAATQTEFYPMQSSLCGEAVLPAFTHKCIACIGRQP